MANLNDIDVIFLDSDEYRKLAELIESEYCLKIYDHIFPDFVSFTSKKVVIETDKGLFFLKEKPSYCSDKNRLIFAADYQNFLSTQLYFVPEIIKTEEGSDYITWQGRFFFLTKYIPGRIYNGSLNDIKLILESLKKYTCSKTEFVGKEEKKESYEILVPIEIIDNGNLSKDDSLMLERAINIRDKIIADYKACKYFRYDNAHGDFSLFNLILSNEKVLALNDFDNASVLPKMQDFAEFLVSASLINYLAPLTNLKLPIYVKPDKEKFREILHYYVHEMSFTAEDLNFLSILVELVWFDIVTLAVIKGDYELSTLNPVFSELENNSLRSLVQEELKKESKIFIWDFSGTLEDGTSHIVYCIANMLLQKYGSDFSYEYNDFVKLPSFSWKTFISFHFPNLSDEKKSQIIEEAYNGDYAQSMTEEYLKPKPGVIETLQWIKSCGYKNIVISNSKADKIESYLEKVNCLRYFDEYFGIDDGTIKDSGDVIKKKYQLINEITANAHKSEIILIGDSYDDISVGRLIGCKKVYCLVDRENQPIKSIQSEKVIRINNLVEIITYE